MKFKVCPLEQAMKERVGNGGKPYMEFRSLLPKKKNGKIIQENVHYTCIALMMSFKKHCS